MNVTNRGDKRSRILKIPRNGSPCRKVLLLKLQNAYIKCFTCISDAHRQRAIVEAVGPTMENISGPNRHLALYFASAIASSAMSYWFSEAPAVGASGAVFGLHEAFWELTGFGFLGTPKLSELEARAIPGWVTPWEVARELPETKPCRLDFLRQKRNNKYKCKRNISVGSLAVFVMRHRGLVGRGKEDLQHIAHVITVNMAMGFFFKGIDNWGHFGGLLGGVATSWLLGPAWKYESPSSDGRRIFSDKAPIFYLINAKKRS
ncbi:unnamed protein product [Prunus armeniaca]